MRTLISSPKAWLCTVGAMVGFVSLFFVNDCGGDSTTTVDMAKTSVDMTFFSCCGKSGDVGNEKGVGRYCMTANDCATASGARICSTAEPQKMTYFCTAVCSGTTDTTTCGTAATCTMDSTSGLYGCVPNSCLVNMPAGCMN